MKTAPLTLAALLCLTVGAAGIVGCASRADRAAESSLAGARDFRDRLGVMPDMIDKTVNDLLRATSGQNPNRAGDFATFQRSLASTRDAAQTVGVQYEQARVDSDAFYREWTRHARRANAADRAEMNAQLENRLATREQAIEYFGMARAEFVKMVEAMTAIETRLSASLSEQAVLDAQPQISESIVTGNNARNYIARLEETLDSALPPR